MSPSAPRGNGDVMMPQLDTSPTLSLNAQQERYASERCARPVDSGNLFLCGGLVVLRGWLLPCNRCDWDGSAASPAEFLEDEWWRAGVNSHCPNVNDADALRNWRHFCPACGDVNILVELVGQCEKC